MAKSVTKRSSQVFLIAVVLLIAGASLYLYQQKYAPKDPVPTPQNEIASEQELILAAAKGDNNTNEINGIKVNYVFGKQIGEYAIVRAVPLQNETDPLQIVLQKVNGEWQVIDSGTAFPELEGKVPSGLFDL